MIKLMKLMIKTRLNSGSRSTARGRFKSVLNLHQIPVMTMR